jgi:aspartate oxidase
MIMSFQCANIQKIFLTFAAEMKKNVKQVAIIGGGAAGFFCAVCLKEHFLWRRLSQQHTARYA